MKDPATIKQLQAERVSRRKGDISPQSVVSTPVFTLNYLLPRLNKQLSADINKQLQQLDLELPGAQLLILVYLFEHPDLQLTNKDLCAFINVSHTAMIEHLRRLQTKGYITMEVNPADRRSNLILLTEKSQALLQQNILDQLRKAGQSEEQRAFRYLTDAEVEEYIRLTRFVFEGVTDPE